jgi:hypothetical protein
VDEPRVNAVLIDQLGIIDDRFVRHSHSVLLWLREPWGGQMRLLGKLGDRNLEMYEELDTDWISYVWAISN